mmetsp:Transcript_126696/g.358395  ORF Transcript_126696/g.358395 Transcript_126696/m.358395 type:complete len:246 (+) Transcript_126696:432-1169(+)
MLERDRRRPPVGVPARRGRLELPAPVSGGQPQQRVGRHHRLPGLGRVGAPREPHDGGADVEVRAAAVHCDLHGRRGRHRAERGDVRRHLPGQADPLRERPRGPACLQRQRRRAALGAHRPGAGHLHVAGGRAAPRGRAAHRADWRRVLGGLPGQSGGHIRHLSRQLRELDAGLRLRRVSEAARARRRRTVRALPEAARRAPPEGLPRLRRREPRGVPGVPRLRGAEGRGEGLRRHLEAGAGAGRR